MKRRRLSAMGTLAGETQTATSNAGRTRPKQLPCIFHAVGAGPAEELQRTWPYENLQSVRQTVSLEVGNE